MTIYLPVSFLLLQCAILAFVPSIAGDTCLREVARAATAMLDGAADPERLIEAADRALYRAKCEGRDQARSAAAAA